MRYIAIRVRTCTVMIQWLCVYVSPGTRLNSHLTHMRTRESPDGRYSSHGTRGWPRHPSSRSPNVDEGPRGDGLAPREPSARGGGGRGVGDCALARAIVGALCGPIKAFALRVLAAAAGRLVETAPLRLGKAGSGLRPRGRRAGAHEDTRTARRRLLFLIARSARCRSRIRPNARCCFGRPRMPLGLGRDGRGDP